MMDLMSEEAMADPGLVAKALLNGDRVAHYDAFYPPFYIVSRYEDVSQVLRETDVFVSGQGQGQGPKFAPPGAFVSDPPDHTFYRSLVQDHFQPKAISSLESRLTEIAQEQLDSVAGKPSWDLHDTLAFPLPIRIICEILGVPTERIWDFKRWSDASVAALASGDPSSYIHDAGNLVEFMGRLFEQKRQQPDGGLISRIAHAQRNGQPVPAAEALSLTQEMFVAGSETT